ncbi:MAG: pantetheine-phosphate adenylyltransferase [Clostridia bacterium]|nr:pantetheine-phosphate adenylyltransferase [Clostridia bacterium]
MTKKSLHALFTGSFDPVTLGHEDIIRRAATLFDKVTVAVFINKAQQGMFSPSEREALLKKVCLPYPNVSVTHDDGMVADFVLREGIDLIVRSVRDEKDFAYEREMADFNKARSGKETILLWADPSHATVSSTEVRSRLLANEDVSALLPPAILDDVLNLQKKANKD